MFFVTKKKYDALEASYKNLQDHFNALMRSCSVKEKAKQSQPKKKGRKKRAKPIFGICRDVMDCMASGVTYDTDKMWREIKQYGCKYSRKQVHNAMLRLERTGKISRVKFGHYAVNGRKTA